MSSAMSVSRITFLGGGSRRRWPLLVVRLSGMHKHDGDEDCCDLDICKRWSSVGHGAIGTNKSSYGKFGAVERTRTPRLRR